MNSADRVLIVGAGGFIGNALIRNLYSKDILISAISRNYQWNFNAFSPEKLNIVTSDLISLSSAASVFQRPSLIVYMAGSTNLNAAEQNPIEDFESHSKSLLSFLSKINVDQRFIFLSSGGAVYGEPLNGASIETDQLRPKSIYGSRNKILEEIVLSVCKQKNVKHMILRLANPYGLEQLHVKRRGLILSLMQSCLDQSVIKIRGNGEQERDYFLIDDLCRLLFLLVSPIQDFPCSILNVGSGKSFSAKTVVSMVSGLMKKEPNIIYSPENHSSDVINSSLDVSCLRDFMGEVDSGNEIFVSLEQSLRSLDLQKYSNLGELG